MIDNTYPVGRGNTLYLNSKTGAGFVRLRQLMRGFFAIQTSTMSFPGYTKEDLEQEMMRMALEAIPRFDPTRQASLLTFLQNHIRNRLINMCKFYAEKRRCASYVDINISKIRCNNCRNFFRAANSDVQIKCPSCNTAGEAESSIWKRYNPVTVPDQMPVSYDGETVLNLEIDSDLAQFTVIYSENGAIDRDRLLDLQRLLAKETDTNKSIIELICQGYNRQEISEKLGINQQKIVKTIKAIGDKLREKNTEETDEQQSCKECGG